MEKKLISPLGLGFFGLTSDSAPEYRKNLFKQIHEIIFHGNGGYSWYDVYNMPRWLRLFTFKEINTYFEEQSKILKNSSNSPGTSTLINSDGKINKSAFPQVKSSNYK